MYRNGLLRRGTDAPGANNQPVNSSFVSTNSMALLALKEGDFDIYAPARQLMSRPIQYGSRSHIEVVALPWQSGQPLPINAPPRWRILSSMGLQNKHNYLGVENDKSLSRSPHDHYVRPHFVGRIFKPGG